MSDKMEHVEELRSVAVSNEQFSTKLYNVLKEEKGNLIMSPFSVSAVMAMGDWEAKFDSKLTEEEDFYVSPSEGTNDEAGNISPWKQDKKLFWAYLETLASTMVELPYKGGRIVMQVLLPGEKQGLGELEEKLMNHNVQEMFEKDSYKTEVEIQLPKFKLEQTIPLTDHLTTLGMNDMFTYGVGDFSGIDGTRELFVSKVIQKAFIEVNEEGSEAAAATAVLMMDCAPAPSPPPKQFIADHPFIFYLRDQTTGMLLFQGRVVNPVQGEC